MIVYRPGRGTDGEKYFSHINYKETILTLTANKHVSIHFFVHRPRLFHLSTEKVPA